MNQSHSFYFVVMHTLGNCKVRTLSLTHSRCKNELSGDSSDADADAEQNVEEILFLFSA
jgi:hypothetical protein